MTISRTPALSVGDIAQAIGTLRQLERQIEAVRQDFMTEGNGPQLPSEVTQFHLRREMVALERQIREALVIAFGEHSRQVREFRESGFVVATAHSMKEGLVTLGGFIFDLEQKRLHLLDANGSPVLPGIDPVTDLYTESMLRRYLEREVAWSQRHGDSFGLLLLRLPTWASLETRNDGTIARELAISMACMLKTSLRGHDFPCRLNGGKFAVVLRQLNHCDVPVVTQHLLTHFTVATQRTLGDETVPIETAVAVYPYDAESIEGLFSYAESHWTGFEDERPDEKKVPPVATSQADTRPSPARVNPIRSVLIVDDSADTRFLCANALSREEFRVTLAATAEEAIGLLHAASFDLIVIDFVLPPPTLQLCGSPRKTRVINGVGVMHEALSLRAHMPILFISAQPQKTLRAQGVPHGVPVLQKPFRTGTFHDTVIELLATVASDTPSAHKVPTTQQASLIPRKHPRFIVHCPVTFKGLATGTGQLQDLSLQGCKVRSEVTWPVNTHLTMWICLPSMTPIKVNVAVIRWIKRDEYGMQFMWIEPDMLRRLQHYLSRYKP